MIQKDIAHRELTQAVRDGKIPRLNGNIRCVDCGKKGQAYDHRDYLFPLKVDPVCHKCNKKRGPGKNRDIYVPRINNSMRFAFQFDPTPLNEKRKKRGLTIRSLAKKIYRSESSVSKTLKGKSWGMHVIGELCRVLSVSTERVWK